MNNEEVIKKILEQRTITLKLRVPGKENEFYYKVEPVTRVCVVIGNYDKLSYVVETEYSIHHFEEFGEWWTL